MSGPLTATRRNAGRNIPIVATAAPTGPRSRYPRNVAVVKTGPGVTCPMATASTSCASVTQARCTTRSVLRSEEHTSELQSRLHLVCRLLLEKKKKKIYKIMRKKKKKKKNK